MNEYITTDVDYSSVLITSGVTFSYKKSGKTVFFYFDNKEKCDLIISAYLNRELPVQAIDLINARQRVFKVIRSKTI